MVRYRDVKFTIKNNLIELPCNVFRVLKVRSGNHTPNYTVNYPVITFEKYSGDVTVDYLAIPVDKEGFPIIDQKARQACYWYCLKKLLTDDFYNGKLSQSAWEDIKVNEDYYISKARGNMGNMTRDDLNKITKIMYNMVQSPFLPTNLD